MRNFFFREWKDADKKLTENVRRVKLQNVTENDQPIVPKLLCLAMRQTNPIYCWLTSKYFVNFFSHPAFTALYRKCEKNTGISPYSVRTWENTDQKKHRIWTLFTQWMNKQILSILTKGLQWEYGVAVRSVLSQSFLFSIVAAIHIPIVK